MLRQRVHTHMRTRVSHTRMRRCCSLQAHMSSRRQLVPSSNQGPRIPAALRPRCSAYDYCSLGDAPAAGPPGMPHELTASIASRNQVKLRWRQTEHADALGHVDSLPAEQWHIRARVTQHSFLSTSLTTVCSPGGWRRGSAFSNCEYRM